MARVFRTTRKIGGKIFQFQFATTKKGEVALWKRLSREHGRQCRVFFHKGKHGQDDYYTIWRR